MTASQSSSSLAPRKQAGLSVLGQGPSPLAVSATEFRDHLALVPGPDNLPPSFPRTENEVGMNMNCWDERELPVSMKVGRGRRTGVEFAYQP